MARPDRVLPFDEQFLGADLPVPLPRPGARLRPDAHGGGLAIAFVHASVVMHATRRVALFAAVNVDALVHRAIPVPAAWQLDERVPASAQPGVDQLAGDGAAAPRLFEPRDVAWGSLDDARAAARACAFLPNLAPQHRAVAAAWQLVDDALLERAAVDFSRRLCVFTGPLLRDEDRAVSALPADVRAGLDALADVVVPAAWWRVCVLRDAAAAGDDLVAAAFVVKQDPGWTDGLGAALRPLAVHQVTVEAVEGATGLELEALRSRDPIAADRTGGATESPFPTISAPGDVVLPRPRTAGRRPTAPARAAARRGVRGEASRAPAARADDDLRRTVAALAQEVQQLRDVVLARQSAPPAAEGATRGTGAAGAPTPSEAAAPGEDAVVALAPEPARARLRRFLRSERVVRDPLAFRDATRGSRALERIMGGALATAQEFPSCCCLAGPDVWNELAWTCSGVLVHPRVVLTAAHCADQPLTHALVGASHVPPDTDGTVVAIQKVFVHEGWDRAAKVKNDLALLVLAEEAAVERVKIASTGQLAAATEVELVGFGYADPVRWTGLGEKRRVTVQIGVLRTADEDLSALEDRYGFSSAHELVAGRKGLGKDACNGDSGGPAYVQVPGAGWRLAGITSRATDDRTAACGDGGVYVRPDRYLDWIGRTLAKANIQL